MFLGLDLSLTGTGCVCLNKDGFRQHLIKSKPPKEKTPTTELHRIMKIRDDIIIPKGTTLATIEGIAFMARNSTSTSQLSALNYMVRERLIKENIPFVIVAPSSLKKFVTGKGNSSKDIVMLETFKRWKVSITDNNICDAYVLAKIAEALINKIDLIKPQLEVIEVLKKQL